MGLKFSMNDGLKFIFQINRYRAIQVFSFVLIHFV